MFIIRVKTRVIKAYAFDTVDSQCPHRGTPTAKSDQRQTTERICHWLVWLHSNIIHGYEIRMFNHNMADVSIEWWTWGLLHWQQKQWNTVHSIGFKQTVKTQINVIYIRLSLQLYFSQLMGTMFEKFQIVLSAVQDSGWTAIQYCFLEHYR
jgi:hypothetical protein